MAVCKKHTHTYLLFEKTFDLFRSKALGRSLAVVNASRHLCFSLKKAPILNSLALILCARTNLVRHDVCIEAGINLSARYKATFYGM